MRYGDKGDKGDRHTKLSPISLLSLMSPQAFLTILLLSLSLISPGLNEPLGGNIYGTDLNFEFALFAIGFFRNDLLILGEIQNMVVSL